jgi:pre-rRNA-processing protein TSR3
MQPTIIIRHKKENLKKCSLKGLEENKNFCFFTYPKDILPDLSNYILLKMDSPILTFQDSQKPLLLIDSTWKYLDKILKVIPKNIEYRSLPKNFISAYPRRQTMCPDPKTGLASIEALYLAYLITNRSTESILTNYYWKEKFFKNNNLSDKNY